MIASTPATSEWEDLVVIREATRWDGRPLLGPNLATALARHVPVLYVEQPTTRWPGSPPDLQVVQPGLARLTPHVLPEHPWPGSKPLTPTLMKRALRRCLADLGSPSVRAVVAAAPDASMGVCDEDLRVFYANEDFLAGAATSRVSPDQLVRELRREPRNLDLVVASSPFLADAFRAEGYDTLLLPDGCDESLFIDFEADGHSGAGDREQTPDVWLESPIAGFFGRLSSQVDLEYLEAVAASGHSVLLVGPGPRRGMTPQLRSLLGRSNVAWIGPRPTESLPLYLRLIDVGLVPYRDTLFSQAAFPSQVLDYLAAGRPVISTDLASIRWLQADRVPDIEPARPHLEVARDGAGIGDDDLAIRTDPDDFARQVTTAMTTPRDPASVMRRQALARRHSWDSRAALLASALGFSVDRRTEVYA